MFTSPLLRAAVGRARRRWTPTSVVLMYHRVADVTKDAWGLAVSPADFSSHLEILRARRITCLTMNGLHRAIVSRNVPKHAVAITFDDGYVDNLTTARPLLERYDVPATIFVTAGRIGDASGFWWDRLQQIVLDEDRPRQSFKLGDRIWSPDDGLPQEELYTEMWTYLSQLPEVDREALIEQLEQDSASPPPEGRILNAEELIRLADGGLVEIGSHGWSHRRLADLDETEQAHELSQSKQRLEDLIGSPVTGFSYPHGSLSKTSSAVLRQCGYQYACSSRPGLVRRGVDVFDIPRMVLNDPSADGFEHFLADHILD